MLRATVLAALVLVVGGVSAQQANAQYPRYYRNTWYAKGSGASKYYYAHYYYAPGKYHHAYYYPGMSKRYVYYYNWEKKRYWGRYDRETGQYSLLPEDKRKENLGDIAERGFPEAKPLDEITIPGSTEKMTPPPELPD
jgi:hypothetical protein